MLSQKSNLRRWVGKWNGSHNHPITWKPLGSQIPWIIELNPGLNIIPFNWLMFNTLLDESIKACLNLKFKNKPKSKWPSLDTSNRILQGNTQDNKGGEQYLLISKLLGWLGLDQRKKETWAVVCSCVKWILIWGWKRVIWLKSVVGW